MSRFRIEALDKRHDRSQFACGVQALDNYFKTTVSQDAKRGYVKCFVAVDCETGSIAGFFTLSAMTIELNDLPSAQRKKLPKYPYIPCGLLGRLTVSQQFQGHRLGAVLLIDALLKVAHADVGAHALIVDAKDEKAASFYEKHGFQHLIGHPNRLFLPVRTIKKLY